MCIGMSMVVALISYDLFKIRFLLCRAIVRHFQRRECRQYVISSKQNTFTSLRRSFVGYGLCFYQCGHYGSSPPRRSEVCSRRSPIKSACAILHLGVFDLIVTESISPLLDAGEAAIDAVRTSAT